jgi:transcriptional regulator with XRE-family HTH domain
MPRFVDLLAVHLNRRRLSPHAFGAALGVKHSTMGRIMLGERSPDIDALDAWADHLALQGAERDAFIEAGILANCPRQAVELVERRDADYAALAKRFEILEAMVTRWEQRFPSAAPPP